MEAQTDHKIHMPTKRQLFILFPFALFYSTAAILGDLEKARYLGALRNEARFISWTIGSYIVLLIMCIVISQKSVIVSKISFISFLPPRKSRQGKWYVYVLFAVI